jgi:hypothetical protein
LEFRVHGREFGLEQVVFLFERPDSVSVEQSQETRRLEFFQFLLDFQTSFFDVEEINVFPTTTS